MNWAALAASLPVAALCANVATAGMIGVQAPVVVERLHNVGGLIYDRFGHQVQLRGFNVEHDSIGMEIDDATKVKAMSGNVERWTPGWYQGKNMMCPPPPDAYDPGAPGNFDPGVLAETDALVNAATQRKI